MREPKLAHILVLLLVEFVPNIFLQKIAQIVRDYVLSKLRL